MGGTSRIDLLGGREFAGNKKKEQHMRRQHLTQLLGALIVATALVGLPTVAFAQISGTSHDLNIGGEICNACHTPHDAQVVPDAPLWNHTVTLATFTMYSSPTMDASASAPGTVSLLCLSCHDGTVGTDALGGNSTTNYITGDALIGTDLSYDHPIGIDYSADGSMNPDTDTVVGGTIASEMLFSGNVECASCHDPHDNQYAPFLVMPNSGSDLCLTCHDK
jgi:predicted CXXCH cytochrome family protein